VINKLNYGPVEGNNGDEVLDAHLDLLQSVGGNWIRNALFSRFTYAQSPKRGEHGYAKDYQQVFP